MDRRKFIQNTAKSLVAATAVSAVGGTSANGSSQEPTIGFNHIPSPNSTLINNETMKAVIHKANTRGHANHGWLDTHHTFSFASYYNPERMHFGALRVLNDDMVKGGMGFGKHPHDNMEIISIPLEGDLEHKDSMGNTFTIKKNDVQVMSAGTGIFHSEKNQHADRDVRFLQIWVFPDKKNVTPRYDQITFDPANRKNKLQQVVSPNPDDSGAWINQDAWFYLSDLDADKSVKHTLNKAGNGIYLFVLEGAVSIGNHQLERRDGAGITEVAEIEVKSGQGAEFLLMEVPMKF